jgi:hypothetical protein
MGGLYIAFPERKGESGEGSFFQGRGLSRDDSPAMASLIGMKQE